MFHIQNFKQYIESVKRYLHTGPNLRAILIRAGCRSVDIVKRIPLQMPGCM